LPEFDFLLLLRPYQAFLAQLVEQLTRNEQVASSSLVEGSKKAVHIMGMVAAFFMS
jgi:hypothetical protein